METKLTDLRKLRRINNIGIDYAANDIGVSGGFLSKVERGLIKDIKNLTLKFRVVEYIKKLRRITPKKYNELVS